MIALFALALALAPLAPAATEGEPGYATYYHPSLHGNRMGCPPYNRYNQWDDTVVAVNPNQSWRWPCGTVFEITGPNGSITATRQDSCPGCGPSHVDLSTAGRLVVCGQATSCAVTIYTWSQ